MSLASTIVGVPASRRAMVELIERSFLAAGYSSTTAAAAVVNAYAESRLDPAAIGDHGHAAGLFQLNDRGAGSGMTITARQDPSTNIRTLLARESRALADVEALARSGASLADVAAQFCAKVERPSNIPVECAERAALAVSLFPGAMPTSTSTRSPLSRTASAAAAERSTRGTFLWGGVALFLVGALLVTRPRSP